MGIPGPASARDAATAVPGPTDETDSATASPPGSGVGLRRIVRNSTLGLVSFGLNAAFNLVVVFILARRLGRAGLGRYYTVFVVMTFVQLITEAGLSTILTQRIALAPGSWRRTVGEAAGLLALASSVAVATLLAVGAAWAAWGGEPGAFPLFAMAAIACVGQHVQRFGAGVLQAFETFEAEAVARIVQGGLFAGAVWRLVGRGPDGLFTALACLAASHAVEALIVVASQPRGGRFPSFCLSPAVVRDWLSEAVPLGLGDVARRLTWQVDTLLMGLLQPPEAVGIYSVAYRPLGPLNWVPRAILTAAFPAFARLAEGDPKALGRAFTASLRLLWVISLPIAVTICVCARPLILLLAGPEYLEAVVPMRLLIWITSLSFLSYQFRFLFTALGRRRLYSQLVVAILVLEAALEALLIPRWGYFGACAGSMVGEFLFTVVGLLLCRRLGVAAVEWGLWARAAVAAGVMGLILALIGEVRLPLLALGVAATTALYVALCVALGALRWDELRRLARRG
jgi:O-antigen/teichoic acid export membrane protein